MPYPHRMTQKLMAPKPVALQPAALLPLVALPSLMVCAFSVVDWAKIPRMSYQMKEKMDSDDACHQASPS